MDHSLADAKIAGRDALVEGLDTALGIDPFDALPHRHLDLGVVVQLHSGLDKPNGIRGRGGDEAGTGGAHDVNQWRVTFNESGFLIKNKNQLIIATKIETRVDVPQTVERVLGLRVGAEVDGSGGGHAHKIRSQTFEESAGTLVLNNMSKKKN